jgi:large subunit ribosomal protein L31
MQSRRESAVFHEISVPVCVAYTLRRKEEIIMREGIHPDYYQAKVVCNCGNEFVTGSTKEDIHVEICSKCHSFYTGQQKAIQARGRIDKFNKKYGVQANN